MAKETSDPLPAEVAREVLELRHGLLPAELVPYARLYNDAIGLAARTQQEKDNVTIPNNRLEMAGDDAHEFALYLAETASREYPELVCETYERHYGGSA